MFGGANLAGNSSEWVSWRFGFRLAGSVVFLVARAIIRTLMTLFLLVGMFPGSVLPSFITEQLIAPVGPTNDSNSDSQEGTTDESTGPNKDEGSQEPSAPILAAASCYSAIRPTGFQFSKGEIHSIHDRQECRFGMIGSGLEAGARPRSSVSMYWRILALDHCNAHEASVTSPEICAHAPPALS
jgi:hypothetical protein